MASEKNSIMDGEHAIDNKQKESEHGESGTDVNASSGDVGKEQDTFMRNEQTPTTPQSNEPSTPSTNHSAPGHQAPHPGLAPIYPYIPPVYYPTMHMPGFAPIAPAPAGDPFLTGTNPDPAQYRDASNLHDPIPDTRRNRGGVTEPFPEKLHHMLEQTEREGLADIVSFYSHGRAFAIHKPRRFAEDIMPRFFKQTRLTSFQRQLNLYGFRRISQGPDNGGYYHELFLKGRPGLCVNMKRTKIRGALKLKRDPESEPNFYALPPIPPHPGVPMMSFGAFGPPPPQQASPGHPMPSSPSQAYPHSGMSFPGYPVVAGPYTAAQQQVPGAPPPVMYGYPPYYQYGGWGYPMATMTQPPMPVTSPVQTTMESKEGNTYDNEESHNGSASQNTGNGGSQYAGAV